MGVRLPSIILVSVALAACGGASGPASPAGLAYALPNPAMATYLTGDTLFVDIDGMGQSMQMSQSTSATVNATFTSEAAGVGVSLSFDDFSARMIQPMGPPVTADEGGIGGPLVFTLDRMGNVSPGDVPSVSGAAAQLFAPLSTMYSFFPGLPGTGVDVGDMWTDTVSYSGPEGPGTVNARSVTRYTVVGDTLVDGHSLLKISAVGEQTSEAELSMEGMAVFQRTTGESEGHVLWDTGRGLLFESFANVRGQGSVEVAIAPQPMSLLVRGTSRIRLQN